MASQFTSSGLNKAANTGLTSTSYPYIGVGTGSATFSLGMTAMGTETLRQAITDLTGIGAMANIRDYLTNSQANGTLTEIGLWTASSGGTLLMYDTFTTSIVKSSSRPMIINATMAFTNASTPCLTAAGLAAVRGGGFTNSTLPYVATYPSSVTFTPFLDTLSGEVERVALSWGISGAVATGSGTIVAATSTVGALGIWSASSGGTLLGYLPYSGGSASHHTVKAIFTLANS